MKGDLHTASFETLESDQAATTNSNEAFQQAFENLALLDQIYHAIRSALIDNAGAKAVTDFPPSWILDRVNKYTPFESRPGLTTLIGDIQVGLDLEPESDRYLRAKITIDTGRLIIPAPTFLPDQDPSSETGVQGP